MPNDAVRHFVYFDQINGINMVLLGLGTNLGDRAQNLQQAVDLLARHMKITAVSPIFETLPWGVTDQPVFYNACLAAEIDSTPQQLLRFTSETENEIGRIPTYRWGPRVIDIDILFIDDQIVDNEDITVPHPRLEGRAFVLAPLAAIAPDFIHPQTGQSVQAMLVNVDQKEIRPLTDTHLTLPV